MKYVKMLGLLAVAAAAFMAFAGSASATAVTSNGAIYTGTIEASGTNTKLSGAVTVACSHSTVKGKVESHGSAVTAEGKIESLIFTSCGQDEVTVLNPGKLIVHTDPNNADSGILTSTGATITIHVKSIGVNCEYTTNNTQIGTLTGSKVTGGKAVLDIAGTIPRTAHSFFCGGSGTWSGNYTVNTPANLNIH